MQILKTTYPNKTAAKKAAKSLLDGQLVKCIHIYKIDSIYSWQGELIDETEWVLEAKTGNGKQAAKHIEKTHPYDTPMIYLIKPEYVNKEYIEWIGG